jgi:hypothetical protein
MEAFVKGIKKIILLPLYFVVMLPITLISMVQFMGGAEETMQDKVFKKLGLK